MWNKDEDTMSDVNVLPELKQLIGAMLFVSKQPLTLGAMRRALQQVAEKEGGAARDFAKATESDLAAALEALKLEMESRNLGFHVAGVAHGFKLENDVNCGPWLRQLLEKGRTAHLSRPALETLAIIAYRQPATRAEIEAVRGVAVDSLIHNLLELQLIKVVGRSELPGKPWQYGTTQAFLEHFGLRAIDDLPGVEELRRMEAEQIKRREAAPVEAAIAEDAPAGIETEAAPAAEAEAVAVSGKSVDEDVESAKEPGDEDGAEDDGVKEEEADLEVAGVEVDDEGVEKETAEGGDDAEDEDDDDDDEEDTEDVKKRGKS
jgi:segregation and condensation protein B